MTQIDPFSDSSPLHLRGPASSQTSRDPSNCAVPVQPPVLPTVGQDAHFSLTARKFFPCLWKPKSRFSNHRDQDQLRFLGLAAAMSGQNFNLALTVDLNAGEGMPDLVKAMNKPIRRAGGTPFSYLGIASSVTQRRGTKWHCHLAAALPKGSKERKAVLRFLCNRFEVSPFYLFKPGSMNEPEKPVLAQGITDKRRGYTGLPGLIQYMLRHYDEAANRQHPVPNISASDDIRWLAREIASRTPGNTALAVAQVGSDAVDRFLNDAPAILRVVTRQIHAGQSADEAASRLASAWTTLRVKERDAA